MHRLTIVSLKALIAVLLALLLICQTVVVPTIAANMAAMLPPLAYLQWPGVIAAAVFGPQSIAFLALASAAC